MNPETLSVAPNPFAARWPRGPFLIDHAGPAIDVACRHFGIARRELFMPGRKQPVVSARNALTLALAMGTSWSQQQIARCTRVEREVGLRRLRKAKLVYASDPAFAAVVDLMVAAL